MDNGSVDGQNNSSAHHVSIEFVCGAAASFTNVILTYPVSKVVFRQMLYGIPVTPALKQLRYEGLTSLYRGVLPPLIQKTASISLMFGAYDHFLRLWDGHFQPEPIPGRRRRHGLLANVGASMCAGTLEAIFFTPLERVQTLLQHPLLQSRFPNTASTFRTLRTRYGIPELYRGMSATLLRNGPATALFFGCRGPLKDVLTTAATGSGGKRSRYVEAMADFGGGAVLGGVISTIFYPLNVVRTQMQSTVGGPFESTASTLASVYRERGKGPAGLFYGARFNFTRSLVSWGIINASYETYKRWLTTRSWNYPTPN